LLCPKAELQKPLQPQEKEAVDLQGNRTNAMHSGSHRDHETVNRDFMG
jgi:hypothetical protein